jgi:hypothetical protein
MNYEQFQEIYELIPVSEAVVTKRAMFLFSRLTHTIKRCKGHEQINETKYRLTFPKHTRTVGGNHLIHVRRL